MIVEECLEDFCYVMCEVMMVLMYFLIVYLLFIFILFFVKFCFLDYIVVVYEYVIFFVFENKIELFCLGVLEIMKKNLVVF